MKITDISERKSALLIGISLLFMTFAAFGAFGALHSSLIFMDDTGKTINRLMTKSALFNLEIFLWGIIVFTDLLVTWGVWQYFRNRTAKLAIWAAILRLIYTVALTTAVSMLVLASLRIGRGISSEIMTLLGQFDRIWSLGLVIFGFHLILLGWAAYICENRIWGILLVLAGISYSLIHGFHNFLPSLDSFKSVLEKILMLPMIVGEVGFAVYLLIHGGKMRKAVS